MALANLQDLSNHLADELNRTDLTDAIPNFIALCEADIRVDLRSRGTKLVTNLAVTTGTTALPTDIKRVDSLYDQYGPIRLVAPEEIARLTKQYPSGGVRPDYAAIVGTDPTAITTLSLLVSPVPQASINVSIVYEPELASILSGSGTNWLLTMHPNIYVYGSLKHSAPYLRDDDRLPIWDKLYQDGMTKLARLRDDLQFGAGPLVAMPRLSL